MTSILVVDDDAGFRSLLSDSLKSQGFEVRIAASVEGALEALGKEPVDILLTDLRMGESDGIDLMEQIHQASPRTRPILMSAFATARDHQRATQIGAVRVLSKPFTPEELNEALRQAIECETGFRGDVHGISLVDLLQMLHYARRSSTVQVGGPIGGAIHIKDGEIVHAVLGELEGAEALQGLVVRDSGSLATTPLEAEIKQTLTQPFDHLLLDVFRAADEKNATGGAEAVLGEEWLGTGGEASSSQGEEESSHSWTEKRIERFAEAIERLAPEASAIVFRSGESSGSVVRGTWDECDELCTLLPALAETIDRSCPEWTVFESIRATAAYVIARESSSESILMIASTLIGRYAAVRFRSQMARLLPLITLPHADAEHSRAEGRE